MPIPLYNEESLDRRAVTPRHFNPIITRAKLPAMPLYNLRHSCASILADDSVPMAEIQKKLGHASPMTTMRYYVHAHPEAQAKGVRAVQRDYRRCCPKGGRRHGQLAEARRRERAASMVDHEPRGRQPCTRPPLLLRRWTRARATAMSTANRSQSWGTGGRTSPRPRRAGHM